jgi:hypothetical protein
MVIGLDVDWDLLCGSQAADLTIGVGGSSLTLGNGQSVAPQNPEKPA